MASSEPSQEKDDNQKSQFQTTYKKYDEIILNVRKEKVWGHEFILYQGFWIAAVFFRGIMLVQDHFRSKPEDIVLASFPKSGSNWFKALIFATINRTKYDFAKHPLLENSPRDLCPLLERCIDLSDSISPLEDLSTPRFLATHIPYLLFPESVTAPACGRFVYVCRDPKDVFVSRWHFANMALTEKLTLEDAFEWFCRGISPNGPYWKHLLSYWKASLEEPEKVLFMRYEDMKTEPLAQLKRLAEFLGKPFSMEEQNRGVVEDIIELCSFKNLSNLEVNKSTSSKDRIFQNAYYFRKGEIGDWKNHLTPEMAARLDKITEEKLRGSGLTFA